MKKHIIHLIGSFIEIVTDQTVTVTSETEEGRYEKKSPYVIQGFLLDIDEEWVYIGNDQGETTDMIGIKKVVHLGKSAPIDKLDDLLDEASEPSDNEYYN